MNKTLIQRAEEEIVIWTTRIEWAKSLHFSEEGIIRSFENALACAEIRLLKAQSGSKNYINTLMLYSAIKRELK